jgi:hypothetical protein
VDSNATGRLAPQYKQRHTKHSVNEPVFVQTSGKQFRNSVLARTICYGETAQKE